MGKNKDILENLIASMPLGIVACDALGNITVFNKRAETISGYSAEEVVGGPVGVLYQDPQEDRNVARLLRESIGGRVSGYETFLRGKSGEQIPVCLSTSLLYDSSGVLAGSLAYFEELSLVREGERRTGLLLEVINSLAQADTIHSGLQLLAGMLTKLLSASFCCILLLDESGRYLTVDAAEPVPRARDGEAFDWHDRRGERLSIDEYEDLRKILEDGKPKVLRLRNQESEPWLRKYSEWLRLKTPVQSLLLVPLRIGGTAIGLLSLGELRAEARSPFTSDESDLAVRIAEQVAALIDRRRLQEVEDRRNELLNALTERAPQIRGDKEPEKLMQEFVRLALEITGYTAGGLYVYRPTQETLEPAVIYPAAADFTTQYLAQVEWVAKETADKRETVAVNECSDHASRSALLRGGIKTVLFAPLKLSTGEVEAVLFAVNDESKPRFAELELEILERFAAQAAVALRTSRLMGREARVFNRLIILHKISEYIFEAQDTGDLDKVLHVIMTGVTAGYGLGFNRAMLLLLEEEGHDLVGRIGVGHLDVETARRQWEADYVNGLYDFRGYQRLLEEGRLPETPLDKRTRGLRLPVEAVSMNILSRVVLSGRPALVKPDELGALPPGLSEVLEPSTTLVIVPLAARGQTLGLLIADNKFTQSPVTDEDVEWLYTFANTGALAIDNLRLVQRDRTAREQLRAVFTASTALSTSRAPRQVLERIVEGMRIAARAHSVEVMLNDELGKPRALIQKEGRSRSESPAQAAAEEGMRRTQSMRPGIYHAPEDCGDSLWQSTESDMIQCRQINLPLSLHGKSFGSVSINYEQPYTPTEFEIDALQLYVNHAAVAYDSARRMETLKQMRQVAEAMAGAVDSRGVLEQIVRGARAALAADSAALWVYDASRNNFVPDGWVASGVGAEIGREFWKAEPRADGTAYTVMERGWVTVEDLCDESEYQFLGEKTRRMLDRIGVQSFIGVSLTVGDEPLGVLYVNFSRPRRFGEEEEQTARTFANHAALALKKARLLEQVTKAKEAAEAVARVTVLGKRDDTLAAIAEETRRALDADVVVLFEYDRESRTLVHPPTMVGLDGEGRHRVMRNGLVEPDSIVYWILEKEGPYIVESVERDPMFRYKRFPKDEGVMSCVGIPIRMQDQKLGVMFINYRTSRRFTHDDLSNMALFSNQAAVAIRNSQLFEARMQQFRQQWELLKFSQQLLGIVSLQETMDEAVKIAANILDVDCCAIMLPDEGGDFIVRAAHGWPQEFVGKESLKRDADSQSALTIKSRAPVVVEDYECEHRFVVPAFIYEHSIRSGLSAPMIVGGGVSDEMLIGVMLVHSKSPRAFSEEDQTLLRLIANDTAVAIQRTRQYEELKRIKGLVGSRSALAWMGMASSVWRHAVEGMAINIREAVGLLRKDLSLGMSPETLERVAKRISMIERNAEQILQKQITPALSEEGGHSVKVNELIRGRVARLWQVDPYRSVELEMKLSLEDDATVRASADWLRRALDVLIDNGVRAMSEADVRKVTVMTARASRNVEIVVSDTGHGIPKDIEDKIFRGKIEKQASASGLGMGLLMAQAIVQTYGGMLTVKETSSAGTAMVIELPLEE